jgi:hypothetical protein
MEKPMIELDLPDAPPIRFALSPVQRITRQSPASTTDGSIPAAYIEITNPLVTVLTSRLADDDFELASFWRAEKGRFRYDYITFRATFIPAERHVFERAWVEVHLSVNEGDGESIAYSLAPNSIIDVTQLKSKAKIGAKLELLTAEMGAEEGREAKEYVLRAWREHTSSPYWEMARTETTALIGTFRYHLVVRTPANVAALGSVSARAIIEKKTFWITTSDPAAPSGNQVEFSLPA